MGKLAAVTAATVEMKKPKKKKGRPPKNRPCTPPNSINYKSTPSTNRRSARRNPSKLNYSPPHPEFDEDDDERKEKKVKLVVESKEQARTDQLLQNRRHSRDYDSGSGSDSDPESEDRDAQAKKRKINSIDHGSDDGVSIQEKEERKATDSPVHVSPLENGPATPLPDKKLLFFILDRLQKKDTYGVFSEAVDPDELPDYFEIIEQPMDFGTIRKKLDSGAYRNLEEFEADIFLICSNAMQYNAPDTIYYHQARSIEELTKRDFQNLRNEGEDGEPQPKVVRRGRPPGIKLLKKSLETSPVDTAAIPRPSVVPERSSGATLSSVEEKATVMGSNSSYNLRKTPMPSRFRSTDHFVSPYHADWSTNWNNEFPAKILRADMKHGSKHFMMNENRRHTYKQFSDSYSGNPLLSDFIGAKRLVMVGLQEPLAYARSIARYAATIGPVPWKITSNKIQASIPAGVQYGPGWVGDNGTPSQPSSFSNEKQKSSNSTTVICNEAQLLTPPVSDPGSAVGLGPSEGMVEAVRKLNRQNEQKPVFQPQAVSVEWLANRHL